MRTTLWSISLAQPLVKAPDPLASLLNFSDLPPIRGYPYPSQSKISAFLKAHKGLPHARRKLLVEGAGEPTEHFTCQPS